MTIIVNQLTTTTIRNSALSATNTALAITAVLLLFGLILLKELVRSLGGERARVWGQTADALIVPLGFAFAFILVVRFMALVGQ